jgi:hypothetical protein
MLNRIRVLHLNMFLEYWPYTMCVSVYQFLFLCSRIRFTSCETADVLKFQISAFNRSQGEKCTEYVHDAVCRGVARQLTRQGVEMLLLFRNF